MTRRRQATLARLCALLFALASAMIQPPGAHAAGRPYIATQSADMFWCTSTQYFCTNNNVTRFIPQGTPLTLVCWRDDRPPFPGSSQRWFYAFLDNGQEGYLWAPQVGGQVPTPHCNTINWINVSDWVIGRIDLDRWRSTAQDGPYVPQRAGNYWTGWCLAFAADAWHPWGGMVSAQTADEALAWYRARGRVGSGRPPRGALVFWDNGRRGGHIAISLGNWMAVGTLGFEPAVRPISAYGVDPNGTSLGSYQGWVMPQQPTVPYNTR